MITVKLYGLLRLDSGIKELNLDAGSIKDVYTQLQKQGLPKNELNSCVVLINGVAASKRSKLTSGDVVQLLSPVAGG